MIRSCLLGSCGIAVETLGWNPKLMLQSVIFDGCLWVDSPIGVAYNKSDSSAGGFSFGEVCRLFFSGALRISL